MLLLLISSCSSHTFNYSNATLDRCYCFNYKVFGENLDQFYCIKCCSFPTSSSIAILSSRQLNYVLLLQIVNWRTHLKFPEEAKISPEAKDLICKLLCNVEQRLGTRGADEIKVLGLLNVKSREHLE